MKIFVLIPCYNEELSIKKSLEGWLLQTRPIDKIIVVDDKSTDKTVKIIKSFGRKVKLIELPKKRGNKSYVQQAGLKYINSDIFITTDGDTIPHKGFALEVENAFKDPKVTAFAGHVKSFKKNWLTACREMEYSFGQLLHKTAQNELNFVHVIPGCASAFRTDYFKKYIHFDHDTLTEDLDFTYKLNLNFQKIHYSPKAIVYTQDPATLEAYIKQMRRWYIGAWQNLIKHKKILKRPIPALETLLMYVVDAPFYFFMLYILPFINIKFYSLFILAYLGGIITLGIFTAILNKRWDLFLYSPTYLLVSYINCYIFVEQFFKEIVFRKKQLDWQHPERWQINNL